MKLGLIQCDYVPTLLRSAFNDYPVMFEKAFSGFDTDLDWTVIDICAGIHDVEIGKFDGFIISGSRSSVNDPKSWIVLLLNLIRRIIQKEVPLVGLCFGHQAIAKALGGQVSKSKTGWNIGCVPVELTATGKTILNVAQQPRLYAFHQDNVAALPENARSLGSTKVCENFIVEFKRGVIGFQGHPEFDVAYMQGLLDINIANLDDRGLTCVEETLKKASDSCAVRRFIINYIKKISQDIN